MGGSQGARTINDATVGVIQAFSKEFDIQVIFQTGKKNYDRVIEQLIRDYPQYESDKNLIVKPYFEDMVTVLKASDIAISRSGSLSISEISASRVAPIFVPYPHAAADHQRKNAKFMVEKGAGLYIEDSDANEKTFYSAISNLVNDKDKLQELQKKSLALAKYDGTKKIIEQLKSI